MNQVDTKLLTILNAKCDKKGFIDNMRYLLNCKVLSKIEETLCEKVLFQISVSNQNNLGCVFKELDLCIDQLEHIEEYNFSKMFEEIDKLVIERREQENQSIISEIIENQTNGIYNEKSLALFLKRYTDNIEMKDEDESIFEKILYYPQYASKLKPISTANELIDIVSGGIVEANIATIVGNSDVFGSLWAINIAYKCLKNKSNVLYITLSTAKEEIYKRLLSRHSCDRKFDKPINPNRLNDDVDKNIYKKVHSDFKSFFFESLLVYDDSQFFIKSLYSLQKVFAYAENEFVKNNDRGIDLIIIDGFSNMTIDDGKKIITNKEEIVKTYYSYLKNQAKNFLGSTRSIPIIVTINSNDKASSYLDNDCDFIMEYIENEIKILSNYIFTIYGHSNLNKSKKVKLKVLKSPNDIMDFSKVCTADPEYWHIKYGEDKNDEIDKGECIKDLQECNEYLMKSEESLLDMLQNKEKETKNDISNSVKIEFDSNMTLENMLGGMLP